MDEWMDEWMDKWMDGRSGWMDEQLNYQYSADQSYFSLDTH